MQRCNSTLYLLDDSGYILTVINCSLEKGHKGVHTGKIDEKKIYWEIDEKLICPNCGEKFYEYHPNIVNIYRIKKMLGQSFSEFCRSLCSKCVDRALVFTVAYKLIGGKDEN